MKKKILGTYFIQLVRSGVNDFYISTHYTVLSFLNHLVFTLQKPVFLRYYSMLSYFKFLYTYTGQAACGGSAGLPGKSLTLTSDFQHLHSTACINIEGKSGLQGTALWETLSGLGGKRDK